jgi:hypothetical protein
MFGRTLLGNTRMMKRYYLYHWSLEQRADKPECRFAVRRRSLGNRHKRRRDERSNTQRDTAIKRVGCESYRCRLGVVLTGSRCSPRATVIRGSSSLI